FQVIQAGSRAALGEDLIEFALLAPARSLLGVALRLLAGFLGFFHLLFCGRARRGGLGGRPLPFRLLCLLPGFRRLTLRFGGLGLLLGLRLLGAAIVLLAFFRGRLGGLLLLGLDTGILSRLLRPFTFALSLSQGIQLFLRGDRKGRVGEFLN